MNLRNIVLLACVIGAVAWYANDRGRGDGNSFGLQIEESAASPATVPRADQSAPVLVGRVTKVIDGDTIDVQLDSGPIRVRFHGIDAPEKAQPHGKEATMALSQWALNKQVELEPFEQDRYDRLVAIVYDGDRNLNAEMVRAGHAWAFRRYMRKEDAMLCEDEAAARLAKRGVWALPKDDQIAPWEYRSRKNRDSFNDYTHETAAACVAAIGKRY
jgi:endonuclease YncB( thermonuclease family)